MTLSGVEEADYVKLLTHSGFDVVDAEDLYQHGFVEPKTSYTMSVVKKFVDTVSTKESPCGEYPKQTCTFHHFNNLVFKSYGCRTRFAPQSHDLSQNINPLCKESVDKTLIKNELQLDNIMKFSVSCVNKRACKQAKYAMTMDKKPIEKNVSEILIQLIDPIVEYDIDSISYDLQNLIGEIGGTLGLTLGLSGFSLIDPTNNFERP